MTRLPRWVDEQQASNLDELWTDGVSDYQEHVQYILDTFRDVLQGETGEACVYPCTSRPLMPSF